MDSTVRWGAALALLAASVPVAGQTTWRVGVGMRSITPQPAAGQHMAGLGDPEDKRISEGSHDEIWCRAMAISDGQTTVVFAVCDLIGLFYPDINEIAGRVRGVPPERILIGATHVHSAPDTLGLWGPARDKSGVDPAYLAFVKSQAAAAIQEAVDSLEPASIAFTLGQSPPRTSVNWNDPATKDDDIHILQARRPNGEVIGTLVNWACHPEVMWTQNHLLTSDYVHYLRDEVEGDQGGVCVFFNGPLGGMVSPWEDPDPAKQNTWEECERIGRTVGAEVNRALTEARPAEATPIQFARVSFSLPMGSPALLALRAAGVINRGGDEPDGQVITGVAAVALGPAQIVTMPGEALPAVGFLIRTMMDAEHQFLLGLTLDELGYIIPAEGIDMKKYEYEQSMSICPQFADLLLPRVKEVLDRIKPVR